MNVRKKFRALMGGKRLVLMPGAYDGLSAGDRVRPRTNFWKNARLRSIPAIGRVAHIVHGGVANMQHLGNRNSR